jgi:hypothetical protein
MVVRALSSSTIDDHLRPNCLVKVTIEVDCTERPGGGGIPGLDAFPKSPWLEVEAGVGILLELDVDIRNLEEEEVEAVGCIVNVPSFDISFHLANAGCRIARP